MDLSPAEENITFDLDFQVWRPSPTVNVTGCYSLVDKFAVRAISISIDLGNEHVAKVIPSPPDQLRFQPGDVLGFYVESEGRFNQDNGVVLLNNGSHTSELVWFAHISTTAQTPYSGSCPYPVGATGVLNSSTRAAPVISVSITTYSCLIPTHSSMPTQSNESDVPLLSGTLVAAIAAPLVAIFGIVNVVTITVVTALYCKIRKLHKTKSTVHEEQTQQNREQEGEDLYDYPEVWSTHFTRNVAYKSTKSHEQTQQRDKNHNYRL